FNIVIIKAIIDSMQVKDYRLFYFYLILIFGIGIITISGVVYIVFYYDYIIMLITFSLAVLSFICSLKAENSSIYLKNLRLCLGEK
ncbi:MAG: hypothetical protein ACTTKD_09665, partial [Peptoanaerobacter stomatis]|uniref:hypothetical protein n=1 Tax=Peptoanaerobacter stomatis TaxID=796937 RepID=UPI003F9FDB27